jgi:hypothetical protein
MTDGWPRQWDGVFEVETGILMSRSHPGWFVWKRRGFLKSMGLAGFTCLSGRSTGTNALALATVEAAESDRALIIAIENTKNIPIPLPNGVEQAKRFVIWLTGQAGLDPANVTFLVDNPDAMEVVGGVKPALADMETIVKAVQQTARQVKVGSSARRYFYFSGHGAILDAPLDQARLTTSGVDLRDAFFPCDYDPAGTRTPISLEWVGGWFKNTGAQEQFFVFDACRQEALGKGAAYNYARPPAYRGAKSALLTLRQYYFFPSSPGQPTFDLDTSKAFTRVLLDALDRRLGFAKHYDGKARPPMYDVQWANFQLFIREYFNRHPVEFGSGIHRQKIAPQLIALPSEPLGLGPMLISSGLDEVGKLKLTLDVAPAKARGVTMLVLQGKGVGLPPEPPVIFDMSRPVTRELAPRQWTVKPMSRSKDFCPEFPEEDIDLLEDMSYTCQMKPMVNPPPEIEVNAPPKVGRKGEIRLFSKDRDLYSCIQLREAGGGVVILPDGRRAEGFGRLTVPDLDFGRYVAFAYAGHSEPILTRFELNSEGVVDVPVETPRPRPSSLGSALLARFREGRPDLADLMAADQNPCVKGLLAQMLCLAALREKRATPSSEFINETLGLKPRAPGQVQFRVLLGADGKERGEAMQYVRKVALRLEPIRLSPEGMDRERVWEPSAFKEIESRAALAVFEAPGQPGPYLLTIGIDGTETAIALYLLPGRECELVIYRNPEGWLHVTQFGPGAGNPASPRTVRDLSRVQCDLIAGEFRAAPAILQSLGDRVYDDPTSAALDAYLTLALPQVPLPRDVSRPAFVVPGRRGPGLGRRRRSSRAIPPI